MVEFNYYATQKRNQRMNRALKERMYLLSVNEHKKKDWAFTVEGSRGTNYNLTFNEQGMNCNCPYIRTQHKTCKHMFFIIGRICKLPLEKLQTDRYQTNAFNVFPELQTTLTNTLFSRTNVSETISESSPPPPKQNQTTENCVICFETMATGSLEDCGTCKNNFHQECIMRWVKSKRNPSCPLCRGSLRSLSCRGREQRGSSSSNSEVIVDAMSKLVIQPIQPTRETRETMIEKLIIHIKKKYKPLISSSERPQKVNTNETILRRKLSTFVTESENYTHWVAEIERIAKIPNIETKLTKTSKEKCELHSCYLFCNDLI